MAVSKLPRENLKLLVVLVAFVNKVSLLWPAVQRVRRARAALASAPSRALSSRRCHADALSAHRHSAARLSLRSFRPLFGARHARADADGVGSCGRASSRVQVLKHSDKNKTNLVALSIAFGGALFRSGRCPYLHYHYPCQRYQCPSTALPSAGSDFWIG